MSVWHDMKSDPPPAGVRVIFGCEPGISFEGFMAYFDQELRPVRYDGDRSFFGKIVPVPEAWTEIPVLPKKAAETGRKER